jgi:pyruvate,water dikinase
MSLIFPEKLAPLDRERLGGKGAALARLGEAGFPVPAWFALARADDWTAAELVAALGALGPGPFAVRSSGGMEDGGGHSFAGQFDSYLNVPAMEVVARAGDVWASARGAAMAAYCRERGLPLPEPPTVLIQRMIRARCAGVAFSADPVGGRRNVALVSAVAGTGERLVSGAADSEDWRFDRNGGLLEQPAAAAVLDECGARAVAVLARECEVFCGRPQDIEWAVDENGKLWLLQSRPITTLGRLPDPDDPLRVWDNSNIAESYGGVTTPLTFSFARRIYEAVYREFCRMMAVPESRMARAEEVFPRMLGMVRGRVYYNLTSWYVVLALLPGFRLNRGFMEQMMGVREPLPDEAVAAILKDLRGTRAGDALALGRTCAGLLWRWLALPGQIARFRRRFEAALATPAAALETMRGDELAAHYHDLERQLLKRWDAPLVNDFFAMVCYGVLRSLCGRWLGDRDGSLQNELLLDCGDIISAEPPRRIMKMARLAAAVPGLPPLLTDPARPVREKLAALLREPALAAEFERYLADFGDRCLEELKLESPTLRDDPESLLASIGMMAEKEGGRAGDSVAAQAAPGKSPARAEDSPAIHLTGIQKLVFNRVLRHARARVAARENLRFERTRLFGRVRAILRELGRRLWADGVLECAEDVFYLELGEVLGAWDGTGTTGRLGALAAARRAEFDAHRAAPAPPDRFHTRGPVARHDHFEEAAAVPDAGVGSAAIKGTGACPGKVCGRVRVVLEPRGARLESGEILVARQTDPGWVVLFPAAAGLLVERGSLLSHSAIVARELRLPCIVGLPGITTRLATGDQVEMDGASGEVRVLDAPRESHPHPCSSEMLPHAPAVDMTPFAPKRRSDNLI